MATLRLAHQHTPDIKPQVRQRIMRFVRGIVLAATGVLPEAYEVGPRTFVEMTLDSRELAEAARDEVLAMFENLAGAERPCIAVSNPHGAWINSTEWVASISVCESR